MRYIECDDELSMRGDTLQEAIDKDRADGLIPFYVRTVMTFMLLYKYIIWKYNMNLVLLLLNYLAFQSFDFERTGCRLF